MKSQLLERETVMVDPEGHWNELHQPHANSVGAALKNVSRRIQAMPVSEVAGIAVAGLALGYLFLSKRGLSFSRSRSNRFAHMLESSVLPAAKKGLHHAYDTLKDGKSFDKFGREVARLRSRWS